MRENQCSKASRPPTPAHLVTTTTCTTSRSACGSWSQCEHRAKTDAVAAALLFHDFVYDPTRPDNEERSADAAAEYLRHAGKPGPFLDEVRALVLATKHSAEPQGADARVVVDIDLSILGKPEDQFDAYERAIRLEYAHVPDGAFAAGRSGVLRGFLDRPSIYATPQFRGRYEQPARQNLLRSIARLARVEK